MTPPTLLEIGAPLDTTMPSLDIVFIQGVIARGPGEMLVTSSRWIQAIRQITPRNARILSFDPKSSRPEDFSWQTLLGNGLKLVEALYHDRVKQNSHLRPIIFCCHSLGGIILKQTLWRVKQQPTRFRDLLESLSGIVFLGTPHVTQANEKTSQALSRILRSDPKSPYKRTVSPQDLSDLTVVGLQFEALNLSIPILSAYETLETKVRAPFWFSRKAVLVDKELARTGSSQERLIPINVELSRIFEADSNSLIHLDIADFLREIGSTTSKRITMPAASVEVVNDLNLTLPAPSIHNSVAGAAEDSSNNQLTPVSFPTGTPDSQRTTSSWEFVHRVAGSVKLPCYLIKPHTRNPDFQGRTLILKTLDNALLPQPTIVIPSAATQLKVFALCGIGGIGKTQVAIEFVFSRKHHFDAIFWLHADSESKLEAEFMKLSTQLGLESPEAAKDPARSRELVKSWLANPIANISESDPFRTKQAKWLLVFDNADDTKVLQDYWPHDGTGSVLLTGRDAHIIGDYYFNNIGMSLEPFTPEEAINLLEHLTQQKGHPDIAQLIVDRFDRFPLAITQMAGYIRRRNLDLLEFWEICNQQSEISDLHQSMMGPQRDYEHTLATVWALEGLGQGATSIISISSLLDPDAIQEEILITKPHDAEPLALPTGRSAYHKDLAELVHSSLVRRNVEQKELTIHRLVQEVVRTKMKSSPGALLTTFNATVKLLSSVWPFATTPHGGGYPAYNRVDRWDQCEKIIPHIQRLKQLFTSLELTDQPDMVYYPFVLLLSEAAWYRFERSNFRESSEYIKAGFSICEKATEDLRVLVADLHGTKQAIAAECNDASACFFHGNAQLTLQEELYAERGELTSKLGIAHSQMGVAHMLNGLYDHAVESFRQSQSYREQMPNYNKLSLFSPLIGRGWALWLQGQNDEAEKLFLEALRDREAAFGPDDREGERTGQLLYALGNVRRSQGDLYGSFGYHQRALGQYKSTVGDSHHYTADACFKVGEHCMRFGNYKDARALLLQSITIYENCTSSFAYFQAEIARSNFKLGSLLALLGDTVAASQATERAAEERRKIVPEDLTPADKLVEEDFEALLVYWSR